MHVRPYLLRSVLAALVMASCGMTSGTSSLVARDTRGVPPDPALLARARSGDAAASELLFNRDLLGVISREHAGNLVVSAPSVFDVLALLAPGARGATATQLTTALHSGSTPGQLLADTVRLDSELEIDGHTLSLARAAWLQEGFQIQQSYASLLTRADAAPKTVNFQGDSAGARQTINEWVAARTRGRIPDLLPDGALGPLTRLVLTSAMALDARWVMPFQHSATADDPFETPSGRRQASTMHAIAAMDYASGPGYTAVRLPYQGGRLDAIVILPDPGTDPLSLVPALSAVTAHLSSTRVALALPRFTTSSSLDLVPALGALGLRPLFTPNADLSGIGGQPGYLIVFGAFHRTWLAVDEDGTRAAAASGLIVGATSAIGGSPVSVTVDRPFLFVVQDRQHGVPLLVARITDPR
ncbi:MAG: serpin family protein [Candidatus Dormibacteria bacterium]